MRWLAALLLYTLAFAASAQTIIDHAGKLIDVERGRVLTGMERDIGSIAAGKFADLVAVAGDPLQNIDTLRTLHGVIKAGRLLHEQP